MLTPKYWKKKKIPYLKPQPLVGNFGPLIRRQCSIAELIQRIYHSHPNHRYFGAYQFLQPTLVLRDPELIKKVTVKEFDTFPEHRTIALEEADSLLSKNIFFMKGGEKWHTLRCTLSPAFTSSKMKIMFNLMQECANQFTEHFENRAGVITLEMKDAFTRYANDVIGSTAFGITCNSLKDKDNEFYVMGLKATKISPFTGLKMFMQTISPSLAKMLQLSIIPKFIENFFVNIIQKSITLRNEKGIVRPDMIHLLMEARKGKLKYDEKMNEEDSGFATAQESEMGKSNNTLSSITDRDIAAQAFAFFMAGFDTSATAMCFAAYELAINSDIQHRLQREIDEVLLTNHGKVSYETLLGMTYMDQVVSETLRKWPPATFTDRKSVTSFTIEPELPHEGIVEFEKDTVCWIPIYAIHRDPLYYPNPDVFDPERFTKKNLINIKPYTYLPFGIGPKNCIGSRFALLETKLILFTLLSKFNIIPVNETKIPFVHSRSALFLAAEGGFWLGLQPRSKEF